jgi:predicted acetyltransferase
LIDGHDFIGNVSVRHTLTAKLLQEGGHIGYDIRPAKRHMGYGTKILQLVLPEVKKIGITKALITCDETNTGSKKIIEANGGIFENSVTSAPDKPQKLRYWITLS